MSVEHSESFGSSRRSYQFDVKTTKGDSHYLVISEESNRDGVHKRSQIMLFPEQAAEFDKALRNAFAVMGMAEVAAAKVADSATLTVEPDSAKPAALEQDDDELKSYDDPLGRAGEKWTGEEEEFVLDEFARGGTVREISEQLMRKPGAISSRLKKLGVWEVPDRQAAARALLAEREG